MFLSGNLYNGKVYILHNLWSASIHLLYKLPDSIIDDEIVLLLSYIRAKYSFCIEQTRIIDAS